MHLYFRKVHFLSNTVAMMLYVHLQISKNFPMCIWIMSFASGWIWRNTVSSNLSLLDVGKSLTSYCSRQSIQMSKWLSNQATHNYIIDSFYTNGNWMDETYHFIQAAASNTLTSHSARTISYLFFFMRLLTRTLTFSAITHKVVVSDPKRDMDEWKNVFLTVKYFIKLKDSKSDF